MAVSSGELMTNVIELAVHSGETANALKNRVYWMLATLSLGPSVFKHFRALKNGFSWAIATIETIL